MRMICLPAIAALVSVATWAGGVSRESRLRVYSNLVLIPATVVDRSEHFVASLTRENFKLADKGRPREIVSFALEDAPVSAVIVLDVSRSMRPVLAHAVRALRAFVTNSNPKDEFALVTLRDRPKLEVTFTRDISELLRGNEEFSADGRTALLDAVYLAAHVAGSGSNPRKMVLVISDGEDNHSRYTESEVLRMLEETNVTVYTLGMAPERKYKSDEISGPEPVSLLESLAERTGGRYLEANSPKEFPKLLGRLDIRYVYMLGIKPAEDGKYHRVDLKLMRTPGSPRMQVYFRPGYYAPEPAEDVRTASGEVLREGTR